MSDESNGKLLHRLYSLLEEELKTINGLVDEIRVKSIPEIRQDMGLMENRLTAKIDSAQARLNTEIAVIQTKMNMTAGKVGAGAGLGGAGIVGVLAWLYETLTKTPAGGG